MYDIIIIGGGAAGLFFCAHAPKEAKKLLLEKTDKLGTKVLLAGGGRCNFTNANIDFERDYFGENTKCLPSVFHKFSNQDMIQYLDMHEISSHEEERGRMLLDSGKAKDLVNFLTSEAKKNETEICDTHEVVSVKKHKDHFVVITDQGDFQAKKVVVATGGKSFPKTGTTGIGYKIAQDFGIEISKPYEALGGIETIEQFPSLMGSTIKAHIDVFYNNKQIYQQSGPLLFTHRGFSGPVIYDILLAIGHYRSVQNIDDIIYEKFTMHIDIPAQELTKRLKHHFNSNTDVSLDITMSSPKGWEQSTVTGGGVLMQALTPNFEVKDISGLYFVGEICDITGRTGGFNLQRARSSSYVCAKNI